MTDRNPYVGAGADGARRSAAIDREEADVLAADDPRRDELLRSADEWERQARRNAELNLAVVDLETTGSDEANGSLLEVGIVVASPELDPLIEASWLVDPDPAHVAEMVPVVREMHTTNGLLDELDRHRAAYLAGRYPDSVVDPPANVDAAVAAFLKPYTVRGRLALAGSGVGHFDGRWIRRHLPATAKLLTYWPYDVGVIRRFLTRLVGGPMPEVAGEKNHRALDDARLHLRELTAYRNLMRAALADRPPVGARLSDGGMMGTVVACHECSGSGRLHDVDELPPTYTPQDGEGPA